MRLGLRDPGLGHWADPAWQGDTPGTHALVIGISRYAHFDGGPAPAQGHDAWVKDCRGLGQLQVSALTAWRVFEWLNQDYQLADAPLVSCHLLLAPQPDELKAAPNMAGGYALPLLAHCEAAVRAWAAGIKAMLPAVAAKSRGLMFFSGHGIEVDTERQVLLPCDYLSPPYPSPDDAIGTENIRQGLAMLPLQQVLLFIDACRNDSQSLRQLDVSGSRILPSGKAALTNGLQTSAVLYATASNRSAYQHLSADLGLSMYGTALLEGLRGQQGMELRERKARREVPLFNLQPFVETRVTALLQGIPGAEAAAGMQAVSLAGWRLSNLTVAELPASGLVLMGGAHGAFKGLPWEQQPKEPDGPAAHDPHAVVTPEALLPPVALPQPHPLAAPWYALHQAMGSEDITDLWVFHTHVKRLAATAPGPGDQMQISRVERSAGRQLQRIELTISAGVGPALWLEQTGHSGLVWGCLLGLASKAEATLPIRYVIDAVYRWPAADEVEILNGPGGGRALMTQLRGRLALDNPGPVGIAARAWAHLENGRLDLAQHWVLMNLLNAGEEWLVSSPLSSLVAGAVLLRAGTLAAQLDWLTQATRLHPEVADFSVMLAQAWLDTAALDADTRLARACEALARLGSDAQLITSDAFSRAIVLTGLLLREDAVPSAGLRDMLGRSHEQLSMRRRYFRAGGLFSVFGGYPKAA